MALIPYEKYTITTKLSPEDIQKRLSAELDPQGTFSWRLFSDKSKLFRGEVNKYSFKIIRIPEGRNSFVPVLEGQVRPEKDGSNIDITFRHRIDTNIFMMCWLGFVSIVGLKIIISSIISNSLSAGLVVPIIMFVAGYLTYTLTFKSEVSKAKSLLIELLI